MEWNETLRNELIVDFLVSDFQFQTPTTRSIY